MSSAAKNPFDFWENWAAPVPVGAISIQHKGSAIDLRTGGENRKEAVLFEKRADCSFATLWVVDKGSYTSWRLFP